MSSSQNRKESQFVGAAKVFQKLDQSLIAANEQHHPRTKSNTAAMHGSLNNINQSPIKRNTGATSDASLKAPPFVSPGRAFRPSWSHGTTRLQAPPFLNDPNRTPSQRSKPKVSTDGFDGLAFSPSPTSATKEKVDAKSWKGKISFQASPSPGALNKKSLKPTFSHQLSSSYLSLSESTTKFGRNSLATFEETPDIQIEVKIPDIGKKILARKESKNNQITDETKAFVPEWLVKQRQREANLKRKQQEKEEIAATTIQALFLGWKARAEYPKLRLKHQDRIRAMKERERIRIHQNMSAIKIQKTWRMVLPRTRYLYLRECRRRRERNEKEIKRITKVISKMPKNTEAGECEISSSITANCCKLPW
jgi:IQ calmodulin-binding motif